MKFHVLMIYILVPVTESCSNSYDAIILIVNFETHIETYLGTYYEFASNSVYKNDTFRKSKCRYCLMLIHLNMWGKTRINNQDKQSINKTKYFFKILLNLENKGKVEM